MARLSIHQFERFVTDAQTHVGRLYKEIEEVQQALNDAREGARLERQDLVERARHMLKERHSQLDAGFVSGWNARVAQELQSLETEARVLEQLIEEEQRKADEMLARAQRTRSELRKMNPELDAREEALKADLVRFDREANELDAEIARMARWFGMLFRKRAIRELEERLRALEKRMEAVEKALAHTRKEWAAVLEAATSEEQELQTGWQTTEQRVARMRQDLNRMREDVQGEAERRALFAMVQGAEEPPSSGDAEIDALLAEVDRLSDEVLDEQERALQAGSEMLGMLSGLGQGLDGLRESVASVRKEQDAHSELPPLVISLPDSVVTFHCYWPQLAQYIVDERQMAAHPAAMAEALRAVIDQQLTGEAIERMFVEMGNALSAATERWSA